MALPQFENTYKVDLALPLQKRVMTGFITASDVQGYRIYVEVYKNGVAYPLTDSYIKGRVRKADGTSSNFNGSVGTGSNTHKAYVNLPASASSVIGPETIYISAQDTSSEPTKRITLLVLQANVIQD